MRKSYACCMLAASLLIAASAGLRAADEKPAPKGYQGVSKPSKDIVVSFERPGRITEITALEGDEVKAGQLLARLDDDEERAALAIDESKAKDETQIQAQQMIMEQKRVDAAKINASPGASQYEKDDANLQWKVEEAKVQISKIQHEQDQLKYNQTKIAVDKLKLNSPIDGVIAQSFAKVGESADGGNMKFARICQIDPLWIETPINILEARKLKLKKDDAVQVSFSDNTVRQGKIVLVFPVGDAASQTLLVRVAVANPEKIAPGEKVFINFTAGAGVAAKP